MSTTILVTFTAILVTGITLTWFMYRKNNAEASNRLIQARPARARIIEVGTTILAKNDDRISTALRFEVTPEYGQPYKARSSWMIEPAHIPDVHVGKLVPVKIDTNKEKVIFPDVAWAEFDWRRENEIEPLYEDAVA